MIKRFFIIFSTCLLFSCSQMQGKQFPSFACNSAYAGPLSSGIAALLTSSVTGVAIATQIGVAACQAEASVVAGPPMQITQTTTTVQGITGGQAVAPIPTTNVVVTPSTGTVTNGKNP